MHATRSDQERALAASRFAELVEAARDLRLWDTGLRQQIYLGDEAFVQEAMEASELKPGVAMDRDIPLQQHSTPKCLKQWQQDYPDRAKALWLAHTRSGIKMTALAAELGLSVARVSQLIKKFEDLKFKRFLTPRFSHTAQSIWSPAQEFAVEHFGTPDSAVFLR